MRKKDLFILTVLLFLFSKGMMAQLPEISSSAFPRWYFIQVTGDGDRVNRVFTAGEAAVSGQNLDSELLDEQLWRFEKSGDNYVIVNKAYEKKLDIIFDATRNINHALLSNSPSSLWKLEAMSSGSGYNIVAQTPPSEKTNALYAHQANAPGNRNYVIMFETSTWKNAANSEFNFIPFETPEDSYPMTSSSENPYWYYIQVKGSDSERFDRVYTVDNDQVYGRALSAATSLEELDKQLWRFENLGSSIAIINKATGKKLDITYDTDKKINVGLISDDPSTNWILEESATSNYYNIKAETPFAGRTNYIYSHQANNYGSRNYVVMFETSSYKANANSLYKFVYCDYTIPQTSIGGNEYWYTILSKKSGFTSHCITDVTGENLSDIKFKVSELEKGNYNQQWKIVDVNETEKQFINRATGNVIQTETVYNCFYYAQPGTYSNDINGWIMNYIGDGQYELSGYDQNGVRIYMNATSGTAETDTYIDDSSRDSGFAWEFKKVKNIPLNTVQQIVISAPTGLDSSLEQFKDISIYVSNHKVYVDGADQFTVRNIYGTMMDCKSELPVGIYLVTVNGKTTKILVK